MKFENVPVYDNLSTLTEGLTGAHIKEVFVYAQLKAFREGRKGLCLNDITERINQFREKKPTMVV